MDFKEAVVAINFAGQHAFQAAFINLRPKLFQGFLGLAQGFLVLFHLGKLNQLDGVVKVLRNPFIGVNGRIQICPLPHQALRFGCVIP